METHTKPSVTTLARPDLPAAIAAETGIDENILHDLVHGSYAPVRDDADLGPIFAARITDRGPLLKRMVAFWSAVARMTGRHQGHPVPAHTPLPIGAAPFDRWLELFRETAHDICTPARAADVIARAERGARSRHIAVAEAQAAPCMTR